MISSRPKRCPLHRRYDCCGREPQTPKASKYLRVGRGVSLMPDGREVCSRSELKRRKNILIGKHPFCASCEILNPEKAKFTDEREIELAHLVSKGWGGFKHDDRWKNLTLMHVECNREQGSRTFEQYIADKKNGNRGSR